MRKAETPTSQVDPVELFGKMDIYLFDQLVRGRIHPSQRLLDAGCGGGRNLEYFLRAGYDVSAVDPSGAAIERVARLARELSPSLDPGRFRAESIEGASFDDGTFDVVICNAVLHFAEDEAHFRSMLTRLWQLLAPGGLFFSRLASSIGIEARIKPLGNRRFLLPDGSERFLVDEADLLAQAEQLGAELLDPIKTTNVQGLRCMTTWVLRKPS